MWSEGGRLAGTGVPRPVHQDDGQQVWLQRFPLWTLVEPHTVLSERGRHLVRIRHLLSPQQDGLWIWRQKSFSGLSF